MVFEDFYDNFFNQRKSLDDSRERVTISRKDYETLMKVYEEHQSLIGKSKEIEAQKSQLEKELETFREDGRKLKEVEEEKEKFLQSLVRTRADFENYKKSNDRESSRAQERFKEDLLKKLIKHKEDLHRALNVLSALNENEPVRKGFEMIVRNFDALLEKEGVKVMKCEGEKFDPYKHEALLTEERDDLPENTIIEVIDNGYYYNNKILKPAGVKVSKFTKNDVINDNFNEKKE
jgi:molecular chaperone GrpE